MGRSPDGLLEPPTATRTDDHDPAIVDGPDHLTADQRVSGETTEAIPRRRLQGVRELVTRGPALDVDQRIVLDARQGDRLCAAAPTSTSPERHHRDGRAATLEFSPDGLNGKELRAPRSKPRHMRTRRVAARRRDAAFTWLRPARRTAACPPSSGDVQSRRRIAMVPRPARPSAPGPRRRPTLRAPLVEPLSAIAHRRLRSAGGAFLTSVVRGRHEPGDVPKPPRQAR
jgi:hypothetical protein